MGTSRDKCPRDKTSEGGDKRGQMDYPLSIAGVVPVPFVPTNDVARVCLWVGLKKTKKQFILNPIDNTRASRWKSYMQESHQ